MIPITICNHKGGTGKTTSSMMIAAALGLSGYRTLVVDLDPQGFLTRMLGVREPQPDRSSAVLFSEDRLSADEAVVPIGGFHLLPSSARLATDARRLNKASDVLWVKEYMEERLQHWDVVLFDTAAALTVYVLNGLVACQHVLIPVAPEYQPVVGAEQSFQTALSVRKRLNPGLNDPMMLLTMIDGRKRNHRAYVHYLRERYEDHVLTAVVRTNTALSTTRHDGQTAFDFDPRGRGSQDYAAVADELIGRCGLDEHTVSAS